MQTDLLISFFASLMTMECSVPGKMLKSGIIVLIALIHTSASLECGIGNYVFRGSQNFTSAVRTCAMSSFSNQLVIPDSKEEMDFLTRHANNLDTDMWVGIHKIGREEFLTLNGERFRENEFFRWDEGQPNNLPGFDCVVGKRNGLLSTSHCLLRPLNFFCENMSFGRNWFNPKTAANFDDAVVNCALEGAQLLSHTTKTELDHLISFVKMADEEYWLGIHDIFNEGNFINIDGNPMTNPDLLPWAEDRPQEDINRNCVQLSPDGYISDISCTTSLKYICVK